MAATDIYRRQYLVQVWFGEHEIASYRADEDLAARYAAAMRRRFAGLRVTTIQVPPSAGAAVVVPAGPRLPDDDRQWELTAFGGGRSMTCPQQLVVNQQDGQDRHP